MKKMIVPTALVSGLLLSATGQQAMAASGQDVVNQALNYQGKSYQYGAPAFSESVFDCSSFTQLIFKKAMNVTLPRNSAAQATVGTEVSRSQLQPGDLLFFDTSGDGGIHHVGIYVGNGRMISSEVTVGVHVTNVFSGGGSQSYWEPKFKTARRIAESATSVSNNSQAASAAPSSAGNTAVSNYTVKSGDSLWAIANRNGMSVAKLKSLNGLKSDTIYPGQVLQLSGGSASAVTENTKSARSSESAASNQQSSPASTYTVKSGDSLWAIATKNGMSVNALKSANGLTSDLIFPGQTLKFSGAAASSSSTVKQTSYATASQKSSANADDDYKVKKGDSLWEIATLHSITVNQLMRANNLSSIVIYPGQHLTIPSNV
ncbi:LysM peptidoglycan-binding domain-containing protein [Sporolactobacillus shoreicorticis]|uniref:LysM peptidoglycan-binding domain-containing protein n=1 Tax=Sporolactobacillus shoreicorticis TaxID=1923877 RepID=A0ABW5S8C6_9BACL|nr:LysM peptidoglycan-binding domain-containing protein [Sporolactobacillus shoreicorticis]MCO7125499.1 LysM peptidoglycan-binding domain-containing protein [Sporolactobacillus shoreicorticis]